MNKFAAGVKLTYRDPSPFQDCRKNVLGDSKKQTPKFQEIHDIFSQKIFFKIS